MPVALQQGRLPSTRATEICKHGKYITNVLYEANIFKSLTKEGIRQVVAEYFLDCNSNNTQFKHKRERHSK